MWLVPDPYEVNFLYFLCLYLSAAGDPVTVFRYTIFPSPDCPSSDLFIRHFLSVHLSSFFLFVDLFPFLPTTSFLWPDCPCFYSKEVEGAPNRAQQLFSTHRRRDIMTRYLHRGLVWLGKPPSVGCCQGSYHRFHPRYFLTHDKSQANMTEI